MTTIDADEFKDNYWGSRPGCGAAFILKKNQIDEWKQLGKFKKIQEYCQSLGYDVKFCCFEAENRGGHREFAFYFENKADSSGLLNLVKILKFQAHTKPEVEKVSILVEKEDNVLGGILSGCGVTCPLSI